MKTPSNPSILRDSLYLTHPSAGSDVDYGRAVIVSTVSTLMSFGKTFEEAWKLTQQFLPVGFNPECIPESWRNKL